MGRGEPDATKNQPWEPDREAVPFSALPTGVWVPVPSPAPAHRVDAEPVTPGDRQQAEHHQERRFPPVYVRLLLQHHRDPRNEACGEEAVRQTSEESDTEQDQQDEKSDLQARHPLGPRHQPVDPPPGECVVRSEEVGDAEALAGELGEQRSSEADAEQPERVRTELRHATGHECAEARSSSQPERCRKASDQEAKQTGDDQVANQGRGHPGHAEG